MVLSSTVAVPLVADPLVHHLDQHVETLIDPAMKFLELLVLSLVPFRELPNYVGQTNQVLRQPRLGFFGAIEGRLEAQVTLGKGPLPLSERPLPLGQLIIPFAHPLHYRFGSSVLLEDELDCFFYIHRPQLSTTRPIPGKVAARIAWIAYGATVIVTVFDGTSPLLTTSSTASPVGVDLIEPNESGSQPGARQARCPYTV